MIIKTGVIPRIAIELFGISIYWYGILIVSSIIMAVFWCKFHNGRFNIKYEDLLDLAIIMLPVAIICARLYYVAFSLDEFLDNPSEILKIKNGGLAIYGGLIGGLLVILLFSKKRKLKVLDITDYIIPIVALCQSIGRWGNYINIEAYGYETNWPIRMEVMERGVTKYVHPTFLYESICTLTIFVILSVLSKKRKFSGEVTYMYIILYSFIRFFIEGLRTDSLMLFNVRISQILSLVLFILFSVILVYKKSKHKKMSENAEKDK